MNRIWLLASLLLLCVTAACNSASDTSSTNRSLPFVRDDYFSTAGTCVICHTNMIDQSGADVSNADYWRSTMMANAARDPYWQATVRREVLRSPDYQEAIEDECATCHTPMARFTGAANNQSAEILDDGLLNHDHSLHTLAMDGVSCTVCHQIQPERLGEIVSFSGGFVIEADQPVNKRDLFGPFAIGRSQAATMQAGTGFMPMQGNHISQAEHCATCHTLTTTTINNSGKIVGEFPEQTPYLEWLHSSYADAGYVDSTGCQGCHMPHAQGGVQLSITGGPPRSPFSKHNFVGGNILIGEILKTFGDELQVTAEDKHFDATKTRTLDQLQNRTATVGFEKINLTDTELSVEVIVKNHTGHKLPTGYPSRRVWLHFSVEDSNGNIIFSSGQPNADGSIEGNDNDSNPTKFETHYKTITAPDQVQIYEAIMLDTNGEITTTLMRAARYAKDNRLLPAGFDKDTAPADIVVRGEAMTEEDFVGGEDKIRYTVDMTNAEGPFTITAALLYQSISYRWVENLQDTEATEVNRFMKYYQAVSNRPVVISRKTQQVQR